MVFVAERSLAERGCGLIRLEMRQGEKPLNVLCIGAHSDDIEIGCGGTILALRQRLPELQLNWVVLSAKGERRAEAEKAALLFTEGSQATVELKEFRDGFLPYDGSAVKEFFEEMKVRVNPDVIFTHWGGDAHQDHRLTSELTWNTFRSHLIFEYEVPKYDGDVGRPNVYMPLEKATCETKVENLLAAFASQRKKAWFDRELFMGLMRLRGMEAAAHSGYAEAFHARKISL